MAERGRRTGNICDDPTVFATMVVDLLSRTSQGVVGQGQDTAVRGSVAVRL
jgi:hypothetical protein